MALPVRPGASPGFPDAKDIAPTTDESFELPELDFEEEVFGEQSNTIVEESPTAQPPVASFDDIISGSQEDNVPEEIEENWDDLLDSLGEDVVDPERLIYEDGAMSVDATSVVEESDSTTPVEIEEEYSSTFDEEDEAKVEPEKKKPKKIREKKQKKKSSLLKKLVIAIVIALLIGIPGAIFAMVYFSVPNESVSFGPDGGEVVQSQFTIANGVASTLTRNTGDVIAEIKTTFVVWSYNPFGGGSLTAMDQIGECSGESISIDMETEMTVAVDCPISGGLFIKVTSSAEF